MEIEASYRKLDEITSNLVVRVQLLKKAINEQAPDTLSRLRKKIEEIQEKLESNKPLFLHSPEKPLAGVKRRLEDPTIPAGKATRIEGTFQAPKAGRRTRRQQRRMKSKH